MTKRLGLGVAAFLVWAGVAGAADFGPWSRQMQIQFTGYNRPETLTNFPVLVVLNTSLPGFSYDQFAYADGRDLRFGTNRFSELNYEIEKWDPSGSSYVWVQVPRLADSSTAIYAYWGRTNVAAPAYTANGATWDGGFVGVWHMDETNALDSTANANHGAAYNNTNAPGVAGEGQGFGVSGATVRYIRVPSSASLDSMGSALTLSTWVKLNDAGNYPMLLTRNGDNLTLRCTGGSRQAEMHAADPWVTAGAGDALALGQWRQVTAIYSQAGAFQRLMINGRVVMANTPSSGPYSHSGQPLQMGKRGGEENYEIRGGMDEVQVSSVARSTNWVWASFMSVASNANGFATYGTVASSPTPDIANLAATDVSDSAATLNGYLYSTGGLPTQVSVYFGSRDGGRDAALWANTNVFSGDRAVGPLSDIISLDPGSVFFFRFWATNANGGIWADPVGSLMNGEIALQATDGAAGENGADAAVFTVTRPGWASAAALNVYFGVDPASTAAYGTDYFLSPPTNVVTIPAGSTSAQIILTPYHDQDTAEGSETATLFLIPGPYVLGAASNASATITDSATKGWYVSPSGSDTNSGTSPDSPFLTITNGMAAASAGDSVNLLPGTYSQTAQLTVSKAITIRGLNGAAATVVRRSSGSVRVFQLSHASAVLQGLSVQNGFTTSHGGGVYLSAGGTVRECIIEGNVCGNNGGNANGGGVALYGAALVTNCVIRNNYNYLDASYDTSHGAGVYMDAATCALVDCVVTNNRLTGNHRPRGGGVYMSNGRIERCVIAKNRATGTARTDPAHYGGGAGVYMANGTLRSSLIAGNSYETTGTLREGGGLRMDNGTVENCTIVRNSNVNDYGGVYRAGGTLKNCIIAGNTGSVVSNLVNDVSITFSCAPELISGAGNRTADPGFVQPGSGSGYSADLGDVHLRMESPLVDGGTSSGATRDPDGVAVPKDGRADGGAEFDVGCYELALDRGSLRCGFSTPVPGGLSPLRIVFTAAVAGELNTVTNYSWDFNNDGTPDLEGADARVVTNEYVTEGSYSVALRVANVIGQTASLTRTNYITVAPVTYVSPQGSHVPPYSSWETAATNLQTAATGAVAGALIVVTNGAYVLDSQLLLDKAVTIRSVEGAEKTIISAEYRSRCVSISDSGVLLDGFTLTRGYASAGAGLNLGAGLVQNCIIRANHDDGNGSGAGVWMGAGTLRNCLVIGNRAGWMAGASGRGAGITITGGSVENCTVARNQAGLSEGGIYRTGGVVLNTISYDNLSPAPTNVTSATGFTNCCAPELTSGTGNVTGNPNFEGAGPGYGLNNAGGSLRLAPGSSCLDRGLDLASVTNDLDRSGRPVEGDGAGGAVTDIGAYEAQVAANADPFRVRFSVSRQTGLAPLPVVLTALAAGADTSIATYAWDFESDGTWDIVGAGRRVVTNSFAPDARQFTVTLLCTNGTGAEAVAVRTNVVQTAFDVAYVAADGAQIPPFTNWATAARDPLTAYEGLDGTNSPTAWVSNGTWAIVSPLTLSRAGSIRSVVPAASAVLRGNGSSRIVGMSHSQAVLEGFQLTNGYHASQGAGVNLTAGTLRNCEISGCTVNWGSGGGVYMTGGLLDGCTVSANRCRGDGVGKGGGVYCSAGTLTNCWIKGNLTNPGAGQDTGWGAGVYLAGSAKVLYSRVEGNIGYSNHRTAGGGVYAENAGSPLIDGCVVVSNRSYGASSGQPNEGGAGVCLLAGTLRNSLIAGNSYEGVEASRLGGGVRLGNSAAMQNCTVARNSCEVNYGGVYRDGSATVVNCIVTDNRPLTGSVSNIAPHANVSYSCAPELISGTGNTTADPQYRAAGSGFGLTAALGNYRLQLPSPCVDAGAAQAYSNDLDQVGRPLDGLADGSAQYDMGAYELSLAEGGLRCNFSTPTPGGMAPLQVVFYAAVAGSNNVVTTYAWDVNGDGAADYVGADLPVLTNVYSSQGTFTVSLTVTNTLGEWASVTRTNYIAVTGYTYVSPSGSHTAPFETWETAATNIQAAVNQASVGATILVGEGVYTVGAPVLINKALTLSRWSGAAAAVIDGQGLSQCLNVGHAGAVVDGFTVRNGFAVDGAGVYLAGGTVRNCIIRNNRDNRAAVGTGAGVWMSAGTLRNCLVAGNQIGAGNIGQGGGVSQSGGVIENCTIARNSAGQAAGGLYKTGGTVANSIIAENRSRSSTNLNTLAGITYSCAPELTNGVGNLVADPKFRELGGGYGADFFGGDFHLGLGSPCLDAGTSLAAVTEDLERSARPVDGDGAGGAAWDMGAYETALAPNAGAFRCYFFTPTPRGSAPLSAVFTAAVAGSNTTVTSYAWDFTNDGSNDQTGGDKQVVTNAYASNNAWYSVKLTSQNALGETAVCVRTNYVQMAFDATYASTNGTHVPPYASWATAARYIEDALDTVSSGGTATTWVADGTYLLTAQVYVDKAVTLRSLNGAGAVTVRGPGTGNVRVFQLANASAVLDGFTITAGRLTPSGDGAGIHMTGGTVRNCRIAANTTDYGQGGGVYMNGGRLEFCTVISNQCYGNGGSGRGAGVALYGSALVTNCLLALNREGSTTTYNDTSYGAGAFLQGGSRLVGCVVSNNIGWSDHRLSGIGVYVEDSASLVSDCRIIGNRAAVHGVSDQPNQGGAGVNLQGGTLRNSFIAGNSYEVSHPWRAGGGVRLDGGTMESCTVVGNYMVTTNGGVYRGGSAKVLNCIIYYNNAGGGAQNADLSTNVTYSCAPELVSGAGNAAGNPLFKSPGGGYGVNFTNGDYRVMGGSPCLEGGTNQAWMIGARDLAGEQRLRGTVDMGAYETPPPRGSVFVVR